VGSRVVTVTEGTGALSHQLCPAYGEGLKNLRVFINLAGVLLSFHLRQVEESSHTPRLFHSGGSARDLLFFISNDAIAGLLGSTYLLLQRAYRLCGLLPNVLLLVAGKPYLRA
jgi:hypothetical protein